MFQYLDDGRKTGLKKACLWSGIQMVCQVMWLYHLNTGHPYCPVFRWIWYSDGYSISRVECTTSCRQKMTYKLSMSSSEACNQKSFARRPRNGLEIWRKFERNNLLRPKIFFENMEARIEAEGQLGLGGFTQNWGGVNHISLKQMLDLSIVETRIPCTRYTETSD